MRKIQVVNQNTQTSVTLETNAVTLGELKEQLNAVNFRIREDAVFTSIYNKVQFTEDDTILPESAIVRGVETRDLIITVNSANKKIASGAVEVVTREEFEQLLERVKLLEESLKPDDKEISTFRVVKNLTDPEELF